MAANLDKIETDANGENQIKHGRMLREKYPLPEGGKVTLKYRMEARRHMLPIEFHYVYPQVSLETLAERTIHKVPLGVIESMRDRQQDLPPYWEEQQMVTP